MDHNIIDVLGPEMQLQQKIPYLVRILISIPATAPPLPLILLSMALGPQKTGVTSVEILYRETFET